MSKCGHFKRFDLFENSDQGQDLYHIALGLWLVQNLCVAFQRDSDFKCFLKNLIPQSLPFCHTLKIKTNDVQKAAEDWEKIAKALLVVVSSAHNAAKTIKTGQLVFF